ncbi:sugar kinase [Streptomyces sp. NPDC007088]|uniref:sugar kinase n=1 Tax=Streptomyces sp. NPDC007088 TaxID=3364773 RepID=UPI0036C07E9A
MRATERGRGPVVCVGETMAALAPEPVGPLDTADRLRLEVAGSESNVAMYLAALGTPARWVSAVGEDPFGRLVLRKVAAAGVDVSGVRTVAARPTGLLAKDPGAPGTTRVHYYRKGSAAAGLGPELLADPSLREARLLHLSGVTAALSASCRALVEEALDPDRSGLRPVSFDVNHRPALWPGPAKAASVLRDLADRADIVFVGLDEAQGLWGGPRAVPDATAVRELLPGPATVVVKDGSVAATAFDGRTRCVVPAPRVRVLEPVGAGDAFAAGFLAARYGTEAEHDPVRALRLGHLTAASALSVTADHGPLPPPKRLRELLAADDEQWAAVAPGPV